MKYLPLIAAAGLLAMPAFAVDNNPIDGAYMGAQVGYDMAHVKELGHLGGSGFATKSQKMNGAEGGVYAGYGQSWNNIYMGAEVEANDGRVRRSDTISGVAVKTKQTYGAAASTRLGYEFGNFMPYMRLGYGVNHFETDATSAGIKDSKTSGGMISGVGAEYALASNMSVRGEWVGSRSTSYSTQVGVNKITTKPRDDSFRVGLSYHF